MVTPRPDPPRPAARDAAPVNRAHGASLPPSDADAVRALLAAARAALERGDAAAYAATATGAAQRRRDRPLARRRGRCTRATSRSPPSASTSSATARSSGPFELPNPRHRRHLLRAAADRRGPPGRRLAGARGDEPPARERHPWEVGRYALARSPHFTMLAPAGLQSASLTTALEAGYAASGGAPGPSAARRSLVVVAGDPVQALALTGSIRGVGGLAAVSDSQVIETGPARRVARSPPSG